MNANTFLANISKSLQSIKNQNDSLSIATDENETKLNEVRKNIADLATLMQQQNNSINQACQYTKSIEEDIDQVKSNQKDILNKINEILLKVDSVSQPTKFRKRKKFKSVDDLLDASSESEAADDNKLNPYDLTPTLVALVRNKMKANEQNEDSDESNENEFSFDYSKPFTHKINQKVLKAYTLFYMKDYETRGDTLSSYIIYFYCYLLIYFIYLFYFFCRKKGNLV
jgi:chromosome segregation ATPase